MDNSRTGLCARKRKEIETNSFNYQRQISGDAILVNLTVFLYFFQSRYRMTYPY